jgi:hypothetical protein
VATNTTTTSVPSTSSTTSTTIAACCNNANFYNFIGSGVPGGDCGDVRASNGMLVSNLVCGGLYMGGGGNNVPLPIDYPDLLSQVVAITACSGQLATLGPTTSTQMGSLRNCSSPGCLFGAPVAVPQPSSTPASICVVGTVAGGASGTLDCATGQEAVSMPLVLVAYLTGDTATDPASTIAGIQPCPLCTGGTCIGGPNNGMACVPGTTALSSAYPTSQDCPPLSSFDVGTLPISFSLSTGTVSWTGTVATNDTGSTASVQARVFSGYCRDADGAGTFQNPAQKCWENGAAVGPACSGTFESCEQRSDGAFGPNGSLVKTITAIGAPAAGIGSGTAPMTIVGLFGVPPSFETSVVDPDSDLPGPGALALPGTGTLCSSVSPCP